MTDAERKELQQLRSIVGLFPRPPRFAYLEALDRRDRARTESIRAAQWAHVGPRELAAWRGAQKLLETAERELAAAAQVLEEHRRVSAERAALATAVVPPDAGDVEVLDRLDRLRRTVLPEHWEEALTASAHPSDQRALRHLGWFRRAATDP